MSPIERLSTVITTSRNSVMWGIDDEDVEDAKHTEGQAVQSTKITGPADKQIFTHALTAEPKVSQEMLEDGAFSVEQYARNKVGNKFARTKNSWYVSGNGGSDEPQGFLTLDTWADSEVYERGKLGAITTVDAGVVNYDDFADMQGTLLEEFDANAVWGGHRLTWAEIIKIKDNYGQPLLNPQLFFTGIKPQILAKQFVFMPDMPRPTAGSFVTGAKAIVYGDFREAYLVVNRIGISVIRDEVTQKSMVKWFFWTRSGGAVVNYQALKYMVIK
jgi:HK97 family phage major capsid protein